MAPRLTLCDGLVQTVDCPYEWHCKVMEEVDPNTTVVVQCSKALPGLGRERVE